MFYESHCKLNIVLYYRLENEEYKSESEDWKSRKKPYGTLIDKHCKLPKMFQNLIHHFKLGSISSHVQWHESALPLMWHDWKG